MILLSLSALATICIGPFIIVRIINKDWDLVLLNSIITIVMVSFFVFVYKTRKVDVARFYMSIFMMGAIIIDVIIRGATPLYWYYPCVLSIYYLTHFKTAFFICMVSILSIMIAIYPDIPSIEFVTILITGVLLNIFALLIFRSNKKIETQLNELATIDALTLTGNRRALENQLSELINKHHRSPYTLCLIIFDLDHFKSINDHYGHIAGDEVLIKICQLVKDNTRSFERLYRYGGEEFIIMPLQLTLPEAELIAEKLRKLVQSHTFLADIKITMSLGVAQYETDELAQKWISRADAALYRAKNEGRNKVMLAP
jgi:diguanylate cyclase (GGDEF)-like protein